MIVKIHPDIQDINEQIIATRRDIHQHPELAFAEHRTAELVSKHLQSLDIMVETGIGKTGVVGTLNGTRKNSAQSTQTTIALRADMDALPLQEVNDFPFRSVNDGVMHACGHDGHTAMLMAAAQVLAKNKDQWCGTVKFIFQPAEEGHHGARHMIEDGALDDVDEIYGLHLWNYLPYGTISTQSGPLMAAADMFSIDIYGRGGHGAVPQTTVDPIVVSAHLITALQSIVSRNTNPLESTVLTVAQIQGGDNFNIISDHVQLKGTTRSFTESNRRMIEARMQQITSGIATSFGARIELDYQKGYPPTVNHPETTNKLLAAAKNIVALDPAHTQQSMGAEDFSYYAEKVPACFFFVGSAPPDREPMSVPHHCSHFDIDERALGVGASIFVQVILEQLQ